MPKGLVAGLVSALLLIAACGEGDKALDLSVEQVTERINQSLRSQGNHVEGLTIVSKKPSGSAVVYTIEGKLGGASAGAVKGTITVTRRSGGLEYRNDLHFEYH